MFFLAKKLRMARKRLLLLSACLFILKAGFAQTFNYSFQKDSSAYTPLSGATVLSVAENFRGLQFTVHIPFSFTACGVTTDTLLIDGNGYISFNRENGASIIACNAFSSNMDSLAHYQSSILTSVSGNAGSRIFKIEFNNLSQNQFSANDKLNYQVWLYEGDKHIEFHIGANSYAGLEDGIFPVPFGLINKNLSGSVNGYLITESAGLTAGHALLENEELVYMSKMPSAGTVLKLFPTTN